MLDLGEVYTAGTMDVDNQANQPTIVFEGQPHRWTNTFDMCRDTRKIARPAEGSPPAATSLLDVVLHTEDTMLGCMDGPSQRDLLLTTKQLYQLLRPLVTIVEASQLGGLQHLQHLRHLQLVDCANFGRRGAILSSLQHLDCVTMSFTTGGRAPSSVSLKPLAKLATLKSLTLNCRDFIDRPSENPMRNLAPLAALPPTLRHLSLHGFGGITRDAACLANLTGLETLTTSFMDIENLEVIGGLTRLSELRLETCGCYDDIDITPLGRLTGLVELVLEQGGVGDAWPLAPLTRLRSLSLIFTHVQDLRPIATMTALTSLCIRESPPLRDLRPLSSLLALEHLDLQGSEELSQLCPLAPLTRLQTLNVTFTAVTHSGAADALRHVHCILLPCAASGRGTPAVLSLLQLGYECVLRHDGQPCCKEDMYWQCRYTPSTLRPPVPCPSLAAVCPAGDGQLSDLTSMDSGDSGDELHSGTETSSMEGSDDIDSDSDEVMMNL